MGDAADDAREAEERFELEMHERMQSVLGLSNDELYEETAKARKPIICSIRRFWKEKQRLSDKQRYMLAMWIVVMDESD